MAIYKRSREVELGASENNISWRSERDSNLRTTDFKSGALTTRSRCLPAVHAVQCNFGRGHVISSILSGFLRGHVISSINLSLLNKQFFFFFSWPLCFACLCCSLGFHGSKASIVYELNSGGKQKPQNFQHRKNNREEIAACNA